MAALVKPRGPNDAQLPERPRADIAIYQGDDEGWMVFVDQGDEAMTPADLTGYTAKAQIRRDCADRANSLIADMNAAVTDALAGEVVLTIAHTVTETIKCGGYVWDMQLVSATGVVQTVVGGRATVTCQVTV